MWSADKIYEEMKLDLVSVVEIMGNGTINPVYKRERRCKHPSIQYSLTETGIHPVCTNCNLDLSSTVIPPDPEIEVIEPMEVIQ